MNLTSPSAQSADPNFCGISDFFAKEMQKEEKIAEEPQIEMKPESAPEEFSAKVPFTPLELQFILYSKSLFSVSHPYEENFVSVELSKQVQDGFYKWIEKKYPNENSQANLELDKIVTSIWKKSREKVLYNLSEQGTRQMVQHESERLAEVANYQILAEALNKREWIFTGRQARLIQYTASSAQSRL